MKNQVIPGPRQQTGRASLIDLNLPQLQNFIKRDALSYKEDFLRQYRHFESSLEIFKLQPSSESKSFCELVSFLSHVAFRYPSEVDQFAPKIMDLLRAHYALFHPDVRSALVQACIQLRSSKMLDEITLLSLLFSLLKCRDKTLRASISKYIQTEIKKSNTKSINHRLNKALQNHIFSIIQAGADSSEGSDVAAYLCVEICVELYRKNIWNDNKTVAIIAEALFSPSNKVMVKALNFFLGNHLNDKASDEDSDGEDLDLHKIQFRATVAKSSRKDTAKIEKTIAKIRKKEKKAERAEVFNFSALHQLNDPQGLAEKLFKRMTSKTHTESNGKIEREVKFEIKLLMMNLISRIIGIHKLIVLNFYPFVQKYLKAHQQDVTAVLAVCAQSSHDLVPPDAIETVVRAIIDNFVTDAFAPEIISAGINSIREICSRCPLSMQSDLLSYLVTFKNHRDKGVSIATRSLVALFREIAPELLPKKERGKLATMAISRGEHKSLVYGEQKVATGIEGVELLDQIDSDNDEVEDMDKSGSDVESGWINVADNNEELVIDDEDDDPVDKKSKAKPRLGFQFHEVEDEQDGESDQDEDDDDEIDEEESDLDDYEVVEEIDLGYSSGDENGHDEVSEGEEHSVAEDDAEPKIQLDRQKILTAEDFARLKKIQERHKVDETLNPRRKNSKRSQPKEGEELAAEVDNVVSTTTIEGYRKRQKMNKEQRLASIQEGREGREKFGSRKGKERSSVTNRVKSKKKNALMMAYKREVMQKKKMSLKEKQNRLRRHIDRYKSMKM